MKARFPADPLKRAAVAAFHPTLDDHIWRAASILLDRIVELDGAEQRRAAIVDEPCRDLRVAERGDHRLPLAVQLEDVDVAAMRLQPIFLAQVQRVRDCLQAALREGFTPRALRDRGYDRV